MAEIPEIQRLVSRAGSDEIGMDPMGLNEVDMLPASETCRRLGSQVQGRVGGKAAYRHGSFQGINYGFTMPIDMRVSEMLTGSRGDVAIKLFGTDLDALNLYAQRISETVKPFRAPSTQRPRSTKVRNICR